jgi:hypothetical protein
MDGSTAQGRAGGQGGLASRPLRQPLATRMITSLKLSLGPRNGGDSPRPSSLRNPYRTTDHPH